MDDNKKEENLQDALSPDETAESEDISVNGAETDSESKGDEPQKNTDAAEDGKTEILEDDSGSFDVEKVASEDAFNDILSGKTEILDSADSENSENEESDFKLAKYAVDCEMCATRVYFEKEDLDENGNIVCPNCQEIIEINSDAMDYYLVDKPSEKDADENAGYIVDCSSCEALVHFKAEEIDDDEDIVCPECGEKIHIETEVLEAYEEKDIEKAHKKKAKAKKALAIVLGVVLGIAVALTAIFFIGQKSVMVVGKTSVPMNIYKCVYYCEVATNYSGSGFDISKKPSSQKYTESSSYKTWDDFLKKQTADSLKIYYSIYNAGKAAGYKLPSSSKKNVDSTIKSIKSYASQAKQSFEDYMKSNYGPKLTEKQLREYLELSEYVNAYYQSVMSKYVTQKDMDNLYKQSPEKYDLVSFRYFYIAVGTKVTKKQALAAAKEVASATTQAEFHKKAKANATSDTASSYKDDDSTLVKDIACSNITDRPVATLLNDKNSKVGATTYGLSSDGTYAEAAMLVTARHKDEATLKTAAVSAVATEKGETYINSLTKKNAAKSGVGMLVRNIMF